MKYLYTLICALLSCLTASAYKVGEVVATKEGDFGVVFYVSQDRVLLVSPNEYQTAWGENKNELLVPYAGYKKERSLFNGREKTNIMVENKAKLKMPILDNVALDKNWFIPSLGELLELISVRGQLAVGLKTLGATPFSETKYYWSCSEATSNAVYTAYPQKSYGAGFNKAEEVHILRPIYQIDLTKEEEQEKLTTYLWNTGSTQEQINVYPVKTTTYSVVATNRLNGCQTKADKTIIVADDGVQELRDTICEGETYAQYGFNETESGDYTQTVDLGSCRSTINLHLTVGKKYRQVYNDEVCLGQYYGEHGFSVTPFAKGSFTDSLSFLSQTGCDSVVVLNLNIKPLSYDTITARVCQNAGFNDDIFKIAPNQTAGMNYYTVESKGANGCKAFHTLMLQVDSVYHTNIVDEVLIGADYKKHGFDLKKVTAEGPYNLNLRTKDGCDSIITLKLTLKDSSEIPTKEVVTTPINISICDGMTYMFKGRPLTASGVYADTLDSELKMEITELTLKVQPVYNLTDDETVCVDKVEKAEETLKPILLKSRFGCDSIVTKKIHYVEKYDVKEEKVICAGFSYSWNGRNLSTSGHYEVLLTSKSGCDSLVELDLTVADVERTFIERSICRGGSFYFVDTYITAPGSYTKTLTNQYGCDNVITLTLSIVDQLTYSFKDYICEGESYQFGGKSITKAGVYKDTIVSSGGCDSIVTLTLEVGKPANVTVIDTICEGETYEFAGESKKYESGDKVQVEHLTTKVGCDSTVTLKLTVLPMSRVELYDTAMVADVYDRNGFDLGILKKSGNEKHTLNTNNAVGCDSIVTLHLHVMYEVDDHMIPTVFSPSNKDGYNDVFMKNYDVFIYDRYGNMICHSEDGWDGRYRGEFADPGVYVYVVTMKDGKKRKGTIEVLKN